MCVFVSPALFRWEELIQLCREAWAPAEPAARLEMAPLGAGAAWNLGYWDEMSEYVAVLDDGSGDMQGAGMASRVVVPLGPDAVVHHQPAHQPGTRVAGSGLSDGAFFRAVLCVRRGLYAEAREYVERARKLLATELAALVLESYERAYSDVVRVQQLAELEEVIGYCTLPPGEPASVARAAQVRDTNPRSAKY